MILLGVSGMVLFAVSVAALAVSKNVQQSLFQKVWISLDDAKKSTIQDQLDCCGFDNNTNDLINCSAGHPPCNTKILIKVRV